jgi:GT2 family glycosyltransferase
VASNTPLFLYRKEMNESNSIDMVSIILPVYNAEKHLPRWFDAIGKLEYPKHSMEIIVCNDASTDTSRYLVEKTFSEWNGYFRLKLLQNEIQLGAAKSLTKALYATSEQSKWVWKLDADVEVHPDSLKEHIEEAAQDFHKRYGAWVSNIILANGNPDAIGVSYLRRPRLWTKTFEPVRLSQLNGSSRPLIGLCGASIFFRKDVLLHVNGFDEKFVFLYDDTDCCAKITKDGFMLGTVQSAVVVHHKTFRTSDDAMNYLYYSFRNHLFFCWRHIKKTDFLLLIVSHGILFPWRYYRIVHQYKMHTLGAQVRLFFIWLQSFFGFLKLVLTDHSRNRK